jgi:tRNA(Ile)-lysidine synthase
MARGLTVLGDEDAFMESLALDRAAAVAELGAGESSLDRTGFAALPRVMQRRVLRQVIRQTFEDASRLEFDHIEAVCEGMTDPSFSRDLPDGLRAFSEYGRLIISRSDGRPQPFLGGVLSVPGEIDLGAAGTLTAVPGGPAAPDSDPRVAIVDADALVGPLTVGPVVPGDRMRPFGMAGSRKLSDILVDAKVPARSRPFVPVVRDEERIVWVAGVKSSEDYRIGPGTQRTVRLTWEPRPSEGMF